MTIPEAEFHGRVEKWLKQYCEKVIHEPQLAETRREPDFIGKTISSRIVVEVENRWEDVFTGIGQASLYAAETGAEPFVVLPKGEAEEPERTYLQSSESAHDVDIRFVDPEEWK